MREAARAHANPGTLQILSWVRAELVAAFALACRFSARHFRADWRPPRRSSLARGSRTRSGCRSGSSMRGSSSVQQPFAQGVLRNLHLSRAALLTILRITGTFVFAVVARAGASYAPCREA